jgi:hypothetical protein
VQSSQSSISRGETAKWIVSIWARDGTVSDATVRLSATPASQSPTFGFGCGNEGTAACDIGGVDSNSSSRQLQAGVFVAASASSVTSVQLTATASAANLVSDPTASVTVQVTAPRSSSATTTPTPGQSGTSTSQISVGNLPYLSGTAGTKLSPGGNASGLFPTIDPASSAPGAPGGSGSAPQRANARPVADTLDLPLGTPVVDAQLVGLGALAVGFILAVTRLSVRKRSTPKPSAE